MRRLVFSVISVILLNGSLSVSGQAKEKPHSVFRDSLDNALDLSDWLVNKKGVLLVPTLITEPAVGYGAAAGAVFFHSSYSEKKGPPSMTGVMGGGTMNGTWGAGVFHAGYWKEDRIRYVGALARVYLNLGFYGSASTGWLGGEPINMNMDAWLLLQQLKFRVAGSDFFIGGRYLLLKSDNKFEIPIDNPDFEGIEFSSTLSEVTLKLEFDSRNNVFTPTKGFLVGLSGTYSDTWMGGEDLYGRLGLVMIGYLPAGDRLTVGVRQETNATLGNVPFYARPIVSLRGAPLMKYQDINTILMEAEVDYNVFKRWFISGFTGIGNAFPSMGEFEEGKSVTTLGTGFRYLMARKLGMQAGMDFAFSNEDFAFYIVMGTAWLR